MNIVRRGQYLGRVDGPVKDGDNVRSGFLPRGLLRVEAAVGRQLLAEQRRTTFCCDCRCAFGEDGPQMALKDASDDEILLQLARSILFE